MLMQLEELITKHLHEGRRPGFYARRLDIEKERLNAIVKRNYGMSLRYYLYSKRNREMYRLLQDTELPLKEIALLVGFADLSCFTRAFKALEGVCPSDYRADFRIKQLYGMLTTI